MKRNCKLIFYIITIILNITVLLMATYGWFISNVSTSASLSGIVDSSCNYVKDFKLYDSIQQGLDENNKPSYKFDLNTPSASKTMRQYDQLGNQPTGKLLEITLKDEAEYTIKASTNANLYIGEKILDDDNSFYFKQNDNSLSSIIMFNYVSSPIIDEKNMMNVSLDNTLSFANLNDNSLTKELTLNNPNESISKVYVLLDYYEASIENIYTLNIGNSILDSGEDISYTCDFLIKIYK